MRHDQPQPIYLKDYQPPEYTIESVDMRFELGVVTTVHSRLGVVALNKGPRKGVQTLELHGEELELVAIEMDGESLTSEQYSRSASGLKVINVPDRFSLAITTKIRPHDNTALEGLYVSNGMVCSQCEAEGFRRITYYLDRPDVMAVFSTTIVADKSDFPVLLSNGNPVDKGELEDGRHWVKWIDPHKKPSYLFALVAGKLDCAIDHFVTRSGRQVDLRIYVEAGDLDRTEHAMSSLKHAMKWDEEVFGLEYDLDTYMIVAVSHFNMGAMENKGLNVFNSAYVLAKPETATDSDYEHIEAVIAHEYFHNWTGNRVTCRDWFQLSLKEGLTVFRDQEFSADMGSRAVKRISDVRLLRSRQFSEDAGPMAHPVRPESYVEINNFYTATVYEKGAEVVRMIHTLLGQQGFRRGIDLYFERHDGQAVTTDDFVAAMADANSFDFGQFKRWYHQSGTPEVVVRSRFDKAKQQYVLSVRQSCPPTPGQKKKQPFYLPFEVALLDSDGEEIPLRLVSEDRADGVSRVLAVSEEEQEFIFQDIKAEPVPSLFRHFSAPVRVDADLSKEDLTFLLAHDSDAFNRWDAGQIMALSEMKRLMEAAKQGHETKLDEDFVFAIKQSLNDLDIDPALMAEILELPSESYLAESCESPDPDVIHHVRQSVRRMLALNLEQEFQNVYQRSLDNTAYRYNSADSGKRRLKNKCLSYLMETGEDLIKERVMKQFRSSDNMTDKLAALDILANIDCAERKIALTEFYDQWKGDNLVVNKWFAIQAMSSLPDTISEVKALLEHEVYDTRNPNKVRSVVGGFAHRNPYQFHQKNGIGYEFLGDQVILLDQLNPQVAARMAGAFNRWRLYDRDRQALIKQQLKRILAIPGTSKDVTEIVSKALK